MGVCPHNLMSRDDSETRPIWVLQKMDYDCALPKSISVVVADAMMARLTFQLLPSVVVKLWLCGHSCPVAFQLLPSGLQLDAPS